MLITRLPANFTDNSQTRQLLLVSNRPAVILFLISPFTNRNRRYRGLQIGLYGATRLGISTELSISVTISLSACVDVDSKLDPCTQSMSLYTEPRWRLSSQSYCAHKDGRSDAKRPLSAPLISTSEFLRRLSSSQRTSPCVASSSLGTRLLLHAPAIRSRAAGRQRTAITTELGDRGRMYDHDRSRTQQRRRFNNAVVAIRKQWQLQGTATTGLVTSHSLEPQNSQVHWPHSLCSAVS